MTTKDFNELKKKYFIYDDIEETFEFVSELLHMIAREIETNEPYATNTIKRLDDAAYEVYNLINYVSELEDSNVIQIDEIEINKNTHTLKIRGNNVSIPPQELSLLIFLISNRNKTFTRQELMEQVWGFDYIGDSRTIDVHIRRLREKLNGVSNKWSLKTIWGTGYKFEIVNEETVQND